MPDKPDPSRIAAAQLRVRIAARSGEILPPWVSALAANSDDDVVDGATSSTQTVTLRAQKVPAYGKGPSRRTRRDGKVPAVIYGHGEDPKHVALVARDFAAAIRNNGTNVLLTLDVDGVEQLAIAKSIQRHPIKNYFEHVDLLTVRRGEKVTVDVPITITGEIAAGGLLNQEANTISVEAEATAIPTEFEVSIEGLEIGAQITAADVTLPAGATLVTDGEQLVLAIAAATRAESGRD